MNSLSLKAAAVVLLGASQRAWGQELTTCGPSSNGFDYEVTAQDGFTIQWSMDTAAETITFQVVSAALAWTSIAFSPFGAMVGSDAVIGLPDEASVIEHEMPSKAPDAVVPFAEQEITDATLSQDSATGTTTVTFTRPLTPTGLKHPISPVPGDPTILLFAYGTENALGYHGEAPQRGSVVVDLFCGDAVASDGVTPAPAAGDASAAPSGAPTAGDGGAVATEAPGAAVATTAPGAAVATAAPTLADNTGAPTAMTAAPSAAPTLAEGATGAPTMMTQAPTTPSIAATAAPSSGSRDIGGGLDTSSTGAPTPSPSSTPADGVDGADGADGDGQDTDGAARVGGDGWAAAAVAGVVTVLVALSL